MTGVDVLCVDIKHLAEDEEIRALLDSRAGHVAVAALINEKLAAAGYPAHTSEASVRRYRRHKDDPPVPVPEIAPGTLDEHLALQQRYDDLRRVHDSTLRRLANANAKTGQMVQAVYQAATEAAAALALPAVPPPIRDNRRKHPPEVAVAVLSDWQLAKVTPTYNSAVCEERIEEYADRVLEITAIQRADHPVRECHVWALGDIIEGELIFPGQTFLIDASLYQQVCVDGPRIMGNFIRRMAASFDHVSFHGVIGNHGAIGGRERRNMNAETNGDRMLYRITQQLLSAEPRISWSVPDGANERNWYDIAHIGKYSSLLIHGDQLRGYGGMPWYGLQKKVGGWRLGAIPEHFQDVYFGHYHQPTRVTLSDVTARCSGSTESFNTYAMEQLAAVGHPSQPLMFVHPGKGVVTAEYCCWLSEPDPATARW